MKKSRQHGSGRSAACQETARTQMPAAGQPEASERLNGQVLLKAVRWAIDGIVCDSLTGHGNRTWQVHGLVILTLMWVWATNSTLTGAFNEAAQWSLDLLGEVAVTSYQGLMGALVRITPQLLPLLISQLQQRMETVGGDHFRIAGWVPYGVRQIGTYRYDGLVVRRTS